MLRNISKELTEPTVVPEIFANVTIKTIIPVEENKFVHEEVRYTDEYIYVGGCAYNCKTGEKIKWSNISHLCYSPNRNYAVTRDYKIYDVKNDKYIVHENGLQLKGCSVWFIDDDTVFVMINNPIIWKFKTCQPQQIDIESVSKHKELCYNFTRNRYGDEMLSMKHFEDTTETTIVIFNLKTTFLMKYTFPLMEDVYVGGFTSTYILFIKKSMINPWFSKRKYENSSFLFNRVNRRVYDIPYRDYYTPTFSPDGLKILYINRGYNPYVLDISNILAMETKEIDFPTKNFYYSYKWDDSNSIVGVDYKQENIVRINVNDGSIISTVKIQKNL